MWTMTQYEGEGHSSIEENCKLAIAWITSFCVYQSEMYAFLYLLPIDVDCLYV